MNKVLLVVFDGYGIAASGPGNPISIANPPTLQSILYQYPNTTLKASGEAVGLPPSDVGNTEVGHINLGAGKIVYQDLPKINMSIADGTYYKNEMLLKNIEHVKKTGGKLHIIGLVGDGFVHSSVEHLHALVHLAKEQNVEKVFVHCITDGRDSPPKAAVQTLQSLEEKMKAIGVGTIASVMGRYYAMDRDRRWERIEKAYSCLTKGVGEKAASAREAIDKSYTEGKADEFILPTNIVPEGGTPVLIQEGDAVIFFNYRIDRPRELTKAFVIDDFHNKANVAGSEDPYAVEYNKSHLPKEGEELTPPFERGQKINNLCFTTMTEYEKSLPVNVAFPPSMVNVPLGRVIADRGYSQLRLAESEKERFVTYYFNGLHNEVFTGEDREIIPSPKVPTYDQKPEMSANELTDTLVKKMGEQKYQFILINYANADMVGHTGSIEASTKAINTLDACFAKIMQSASINDYTILLTADHGNVEQKINPTTGQTSTEHTSNPVPFVAVSDRLKGQMVKLESGILADVAPTVLGLMGIPPPSDMTGRDLLAGLMQD